MSAGGDTAFELTGELPAGVTVLEASAGTGKTFTIAALAARFVADGVGLDKLLLVTFTRVASGELRERVRERLVFTDQELARVLAGAEPSTDDAVTLLLADGPDPSKRDLELVELRRRRLAEAVAAFDSATIETTHGFCQKVLDELGTLADLEPDVQFVDNVDDLISDVVDDLYVRAFYRRDERDPVRLTRQDAGRIATLAIDNPRATVHPQAPADPNQTARQRLALAARAEFESRKRRLGLMTHDDQLTRLLGTLESESGPAAVASLRARYSVVLIDEFQDTDPLQWEIVRRAFADGQTTLVLIGDPKQAIYAFRGADVYAYLDAARSAGARATLDVNRRSDGPLLHAFDALFDGARLGEDEIAYRTVQAAPGNSESRLRDAPQNAPVRLRVVDRTDPAVTLTPSGAAAATETQEFVARDLAQDIERLLSSDATITRRDGTPTPVVPGDIAVLVRSRWQAGLVQSALDTAQVPAVIAGAGSVFETRSALHWLALLEALERPSASTRARTAALTPFIGYSARRLALAGETELEELHRKLHVWSRVLREHGVAPLAQTVMHGERVAGRLLGFIDGERQVTDLQHIAQLLHAAAGSEGLGPAALTGWLRQRIDAAGSEGTDERARRLDSDADAVQILTFHRSKGLEFPIVYCPFLWHRGRGDDGRPPIYFHDQAQGGRRAIDVAGGGSEYDEHRRRYETEELGEDLRLMYVALTRARHQVVMWWAGSYFGKDSPLTRLLMAKQLDGTIGTGLGAPPSDADAMQAMQRVAGRAPGCVSVELAALALARVWGGELHPAAELRTAEFSRSIDRQWRRTSYSAITAQAHEALVATEPEARGISDEPAPEQPPLPGDVQELPLAAMSAGPVLGTVVHHVLEQVDFTDPDLETGLTRLIEAQSGPRRSELLGCSAQVAARGLTLALQTPLGGDLGDLTLAGVQRRDRLDELTFELPLAGGDSPSGTVTLRQMSSLLADHLTVQDPLFGYAERLLDPSLSGLIRGYLTGSIDLALRTHDGPAGQPRFVVVDYKTNWLAPAGETLSLRHYAPMRLAQTMLSTHYALQALLYSVALHRFLRWRLPGYDPHAHLGGVRYLFLRGMTGPSVPDRPSGVFVWNPPPSMISELSDLLDADA